MIKKFTIFLISFLLFGCGFHLRGQIDIPKELYNLNLDIPDKLENSIFITELKSSFKEYKINLYDKNKKLLTLKIYNEKFHKETFTTNSASIVNQYKLTYTINFELKNQKCDILNKPQKITITKTFNSNPNTMLDNDNEERLLKQEMRRSAIHEIIRRISRISKLRVYKDQNKKQNKN